MNGRLKSGLVTAALKIQKIKDCQDDQASGNRGKYCMTHDINTINIPQYNPSQWGVVQIGF